MAAAGSPPLVGVLAFQGSVGPHVEALRRVGASARRVRDPKDLIGLTHLVIPGGESTVIAQHLRERGLTKALRSRAEEGSLAFFGTCAGAILLGREAPGELEQAGPQRQPERLGVASVSVRRNAYGRQIDSFRGPIDLSEPLDPTVPFPGVFIRAPRFEELPSSARVLGRESGDPVLVLQGRVLLAAFHPELTQDPRIHRFFLTRV
ncbi:MAG: pyridoxal 5'-phosphate synthase glutaminase subunit PdxT [Planctomycetota bacterium]|jgi:5'-phosphate synthase pdxT subunit